MKIRYHTVCKPESVTRIDKYTGARGTGLQVTVLISSAFYGPAGSRPDSDHPPALFLCGSDDLRGLPRTRQIAGTDPANVKAASGDGFARLLRLLNTKRW